MFDGSSCGYHGDRPARLKRGRPYHNHHLAIWIFRYIGAAHDIGTHRCRYTGKGEAPVHPGHRHPARPIEIAVGQFRKFAPGRRRASDACHLLSTTGRTTRALISGKRAPVPSTGSAFSRSALSRRCWRAAHHARSLRALDAFLHGFEKGSC